MFAKNRLSRIAIPDLQVPARVLTTAETTMVKGGDAKVELLKFLVVDVLIGSGKKLVEFGTYLGDKACAATNCTQPKK